MNTKDWGYRALEWLAIAATFCAPVTTGYVIARNLIDDRAFLPAIALTAAMAVELLGFAAANVALAHHSIDAAQKRRATLPTGLAVLALLAYVGVAMVLTWAIEGDPVLALFPLLSLVGSGVLALTQELKRREGATSDSAAQAEIVRKAEQEARRESARLESERLAARDRLAAERQARLDEQSHQEKLAEIAARKEAKVARIQAQQAQLRAQLEAQPEQSDELHGNRLEIYEILQATPHATPTQLGMQLGITRQAVGKHLEALEKAGYISRNGKGNH
jgi:DNA-binding transcriptional ArsR family regulator